MSYVFISANNLIFWSLMMLKLVSRETASVLCENVYPDQAQNQSTNETIVSQRVNICRKKMERLSDTWSIFHRRLL